jgi:hypothetical protein
MFPLVPGLEKKKKLESIVIVLFGVYFGFPSPKDRTGKSDRTFKK